MLRAAGILALVRQISGAPDDQVPIPPPELPLQSHKLSSSVSLPNLLAPRTPNAVRIERSASTSNLRATSPSPKDRPSRTKRPEMPARPFHLPRAHSPKPAKPQIQPVAEDALDDALGFSSLQPLPRTESSSSLAALSVSTQSRLRNTPRSVGGFSPRLNTSQNAPHSGSTLELEVPISLPPGHSPVTKLDSSAAVPPPRLPPTDLAIPREKFSITAETPLDDIISYFERVAKLDNYTSKLEHNQPPAAQRRGGTACVYRIATTYNTYLAVKCIFMQPSAEKDKTLKRSARELEIWSRLKHKNILPLLGLAKYQGHIAMVSTWMSLGSVVAFINDRPNENRYFLSKKVVEAVAYLHSREIVHGDIKGDNVLMSDDGEPMLTDFGLTITNKSSLILSTTDGGGGSWRWMAPELLGSKGCRSKEADVYALGMTILEILTGVPPFAELASLYEILDAVKRRRKTPRRPECLTPPSPLTNAFWTVMTKCWTYKPARRIKIIEVEELIASNIDEGRRQQNPVRAIPESEKAPSSGVMRINLFRRRAPNDTKSQAEPVVLENRVGHGTNPTIFGFPDKWLLSSFCTWASQNPEFADAPIRLATYNRLNAHESVLLSCELASTATRPATTLWLRIERRPSRGGVSVLLNKAKPAEDTVSISTTRETLCEPGSSQGFFGYGPTERPLQVLKLKHIAEMYQYFIRHSPKYSILGANSCWLCLALFECLEGCQRCFGGHWIGSRPERPTAGVQTTLEVKDIYLKEKHRTCCGSLLQSCSAIGTVASGIAPDWASSLAGSSLDKKPRSSQVFAESSVISATAPPVPGIQSGVLENSEAGQFEFVVPDLPTPKVAQGSASLGRQLSLKPYTGILPLRTATASDDSPTPTQIQVIVIRRTVIFPSPAGRVSSDMSRHPSMSKHRAEQAPVGSAVEVLELSDGQIVWSVVDGLRAVGEDFQGDNPSPFPCMSRASEYSTPETHEPRFREHQHSASKSSATSTASKPQKPSPPNRAETRVYYSSAGDIGTLIDCLTKNSEAGQFNIVPGLPTIPTNLDSLRPQSGAQSTRSFSTSYNSTLPDGDWTLEERIDQMIAASHKRSGL